MKEIFLIILVIIYVVIRCHGNIRRDVFDISASDVVELFRDIVDDCPDQIALKYMKRGKLREVSYNEYYKWCKTYAKNLHRHFGNKSGINTLIIGTNSPVWLYSYWGTIMNGGIVVCAYHDLPIERYEKMILDAKPDVIVIEDVSKLPKLANILSTENNSVKLIVTYAKHTDPKIREQLKEHVPIISFDKFMKKKGSKLSKKLGKNIIQVYNNSCDEKTIITHKQVMDNIVNSLQYLTRKEDKHIELAGEKMLNYLPFSDITVQIFDIYITMAIAGTLHISNIGTDDVLVDNLRKIKPTIMFGVPKIWDRLFGKMESGLNPGGLTIVDRQNLGLDDCKFNISGTDKLDDQLLENFSQIGIDIDDVFCSRETTGPVFKLYDDLNLKIKDNLIIVNNKQIGDIGEIIDNKINITSRADKLVHVAGLSPLATSDDTVYGNSINVKLLEERIANQLPFVEYAIVFSNKPQVIYDKPQVKNSAAEYLILLLTLKVQNIGNGDNTILLTDDIDVTGSDAKTITDAVDNKIVHKYISDAVADINDEIDGPCKIGRWFILSHSYTSSSGELSPLFKPLCDVIMTKYITPPKPKEDPENRTEPDQQ